MNDNRRSELKEILGITDSTIIDGVLLYAKRLVMSGRKANDYVLARDFSNRVTRIVDMVSVAYNLYSSDAQSINVQAINRSYILLVNELKQFYTQNKELSDIEPKPIWNSFDVIESKEYEIQEYVYHYENNTGSTHNAQINRLCITSGLEILKYTTEQKKIIDYADKAIANYDKQLAEVVRNNQISEDRRWFIPEYRFVHNDDGTLLVNGVTGVLKVKKVQAGQASEKLLEQARNKPNELFKPDLGKYSRNISTMLSSLGFTGSLKELFFPIVSNSKGIKFRPVVSRTIADAAGIDTVQLDGLLKSLGATIEEKPLDLNDIPF